MSAPDKGILYLAADNRRAAADYLRQRGLDSFIYVAQMVRHRLPFRSWPSTHYHALLRMLHERLALPIVVDTVAPTRRPCRTSAWTPEGSTC
jgi:hypothetical protein